MKITDLRTEVVRIPMKHTFKVVFAEIDESVNVLVKLQTEDGLCGYGEAAPFAPSLARAWRAFWRPSACSVRG